MSERAYVDAEQFGGYLILQGLSDATIRNYRAMYVRWLDWCATNHADPSLPTAMEVRAWSEETIKRSSSMRQQAAAVLSHMCAILGVDDEIKNAVEVPRKPRPRRRALSEADADRLEEAAHRAGIAGTAVLCGLYTAARRGEIAGFEWEKVAIEREVDEETGEVAYGGWVTFWRPKGRDWHSVPLHPVLAEHLYVRRLEGEQWLFSGRYGGHVSPATIWQWCMQVAEDAGLEKVTPHQLRHTALTAMNDLSGDLRAAQQFAGHQSPTVTAGYTRKSDEKLRETVCMINYRAEKKERKAS